MTRRSRWLLALALGVGCLGLAAWAQLATPRGPKLYGFKVVTAYPHDPMAFTQGLVIRDGVLYEGTGQYGASSIRRVDLATGRVDKLHSLPSQYFGEGITVLDGKLYELTWKSGVGFVYDAGTFNLQKTFPYSGEGWGLTDDGKQLIMSDGSAKLRFIDPTSLETVREVTVRRRRPADRPSERARVHRRRSLVERLVRGPHRAYRARHRQGDRLGGVESTLSRVRAAQRGGAERHRVRQGHEEAVRHRQGLAADLRDSTDRSLSAARASHRRGRRGPRACTLRRPVV